MMEAFLDLEPLRAIAWPRSSGKTSFMAYEVEMMSHLPKAQIIIIHPTEDEGQFFENTYLHDLGTSQIINLSYDEIKDKEFITNLLKDIKDLQIYLFFSEVDYFDLINPEEVPIFCGRFLASLLLLDEVSVTQVTYIGTIWQSGSYLSKICLIPPLVHSVHPREIWHDSWRDRALALKPLLSEDQFKFHVLGEH